MTSTQDTPVPWFASRHVNLADPRLGARAVLASDEFFAPKERMLEPQPAIFVPDRFDDHGKWMDGWETRRRRTTGHDWCIVQLARPGVLKGIDIDTSHFTGNYPSAASLEAAHLGENPPQEDAPWHEILPATTLQPNSHHYLALGHADVFDHVRLNIHPDGGIARLRVWGQPHVDWRMASDHAVDLAAMAHGGRVIAANNQHFGAASNILLPDKSLSMGDGWETRRRREPGCDWVIVALAHPGIIERIVIDTAHFKGNFPDSVSLQAALVPSLPDNALVPQAMFWPLLLDEQRLAMDQEHVFFSGEVRPLGPVSHVRLNIHPDGGIARLRLWGMPQA
jgi:allantoicase